jgi:hypothetical protein
MNETEDIYSVMRRLGASEDLILGIAAVTGGKLIYHPEIVKKAERQKLREAVLSDPSGNMREIAQRHHVPLSTVYFWRSQELKVF